MFITSGKTNAQLQKNVNMGNFQKPVLWNNL